MERERRQTRLILISGAAVILLVVLLIGYGVLDQNVLQARRPVAVVNGEGISTTAYQGQVRYARYSLIRNAENTAQFMQYFGSDPNTAAQFVSQLQQIQSQLEPQTIGKTVLDQMVDNDLIRQWAKANNVTVTQEELDKAFQEAFGYFPNGTPTPSPTFEALATSTLSPLQMTLMPPTATPTATPVVTATASLTGTQGVTTTAGVTATVVATATELAPTPTLGPTEALTPTATSAPTSTPTPYTQEGYQKLYKDTIDNFSKTYGITEADLRYLIESQLYREKVMEKIVGNLPHTEDEVWARHILVADEQTANDVLARLNNGEDFCAVAKEVSTDTSNKDSCGDLGWFPKEGKMVQEFADAAFALNVGQISQPVKTTFGYHIIQSLGHEERPLSDSDYEQLKQTKFQDWLTQQKDASKVDIRDYWTERVPTEPTLPPEIDTLIQNAAQQQQQQQSLPLPTTP